MLMAKTQKNLQLPEYVLNWFETMELQTGVNHSRIALAAIIAYMLMDETSQGLWLRLAVHVEKGRIDFADFPKPHSDQDLWISDSFFRCLAATMKKAMDRGATEADLQVINDLKAAAKASLPRARQRLTQAEQRRD
jgi:hypothetical protein